MQDNDLNHITDAAIETMVYRAIAKLSEDGSLLRKVALAEIGFLNVQDIATATGKSEKTIRRWCDAGHIRMFLLPGDHDLATTPQIWREDRQRLIEEGMIRVERRRNGRRVGQRRD